MVDIVKDVSTLSTIPEKTLHKLLKKFIYCICDCVAEDKLQGNEVSELYIGLGILYIRYEDNMIKYKFIPGDPLEKAVTQTVVSKQNLLENTLNESLVKKFMEVYKDLC